LGGAIPTAGVVEQIRASDPTVICMHLEHLPEGLVVRFSLLQDEAATEVAWARARAEGWARRGRK
jgi:hypothetical protein